MKLNMISCIFLVLLLPVSMVLLKCANSPLVIYFLNFVQLFRLACFLCDLLSPLGPNDYSCKDNFSFVSQIKNANLSKIILVSYDVTSLQETIDIAINLIFNHNNNLSITRKELKNLFLFATSQNRFVFNKTFYNQIDGVAMCSPLAPALANIFMGFHKSKWLNEYNLNKPKFYLRDIDDILAALDNEQD